MLKEKIKKLPIIGPLLLTFIHRVKGVPVFKTSGQYWEERYRKGGNSGAGSYDELAKFKGRVINKWVAQEQIESVIEWGCGDGNQLQYFDFKSYVGYDVSATAIALCQQLYQADASKKFQLIEDYSGEKADLTLSLDVIYHLIEDEVYETYMKQLFASSRKFVMVYASDFEEEKKAVAHVKHRKFTNWVQSNVPDFQLVKRIANDFPFDGNQATSSISDFYIFQKIDKGRESQMS